MYALTKVEKDELRAISEKMPPFVCGKHGQIDEPYLCRNEKVSSGIKRQCPLCRNGNLSRYRVKREGSEELPDNPLAQETDSVKMVQDPKMFLQIIKAITGGNGTHAINIINGIQFGEIKIEQPKKEFALFAYLNTLRPLRRKSLRDRCIEAAKIVFKSDKAAAEFLGIDRRILMSSYQIQRKSLSKEEVSEE